jgi:hypothetical protein
MKVLLLSMFYADAGKHLADRASHLFSKRDVTRWVFSVRPHNDMTEYFLASMAEHLGKEEEQVVIYREQGDQPTDRLERLSLAGDRLLSSVGDEDYILWHESDLFTPIDVFERLAAVGSGAAGGWPVLSHDPARPDLGVTTPKRMVIDPPIFYDTWGYRAGGTRFSSLTPYHECYRPEPFELESVGSVVLVQAEYVRRGARMNGGGLVGLCQSIRDMGGQVWCDPTVTVVQPAELWTMNND